MGTSDDGLGSDIVMNCEFDKTAFIGSNVFNLAFAVSTRDFKQLINTPTIHLYQG